jgi:hypothetical protein
MHYVNRLVTAAAGWRDACWCGGAALPGGAAGVPAAGGGTAARAAADTAHGARCGWSAFACCFMVVCVLGRRCASSRWRHCSRSRSQHCPRGQVGRVMFCLLLHGCLCVMGWRCASSMQQHCSQSSSRHCRRGQVRMDGCWYGRACWLVV